MRHRLHHFCLLVGLLGFSLSEGRAQTPDAGMEVFAGGGPAWMMFGGDETLIAGAHVRGGGGVRIRSGLGAELITSWSGGAHEWPGGGFRVSGVGLAGRGLYHLSEGRAQPYVFAGAGIVRWTRVSMIVDAAGAPTFRETGVDFGPTFGAGVRGYLRPDLYLRMEGQFTMDPAGIRLSFGSGYHW